MNSRISFQDVGKTFPLKGTEFTALDGVSLDIADRSSSPSWAPRAAASPP